MKQTAVEFMVEELDKSIGLTKFVDTCDEEYKQEILGIIKQAKAMEKEQIMDAYIEASPRLEDIIKESAEQYYEQKFKSE